MISFLVECAWVFIMTAATDYVWAKYMTAAADRRALPAALWSGAIIAFGAFVVTAYVEDHRLILPAIAGAIVGTYLPLRFGSNK